MIRVGLLTGRSGDDGRWSLHNSAGGGVTQDASLLARLRSGGGDGHKGGDCDLIDQIKSFR